MNTRNEDNTAKVIQLEDFDRSLGTDELNLAEFPLSVLATRSEPGQNTLLFEDTIFDERAGKQINRSLVVAGSDHFGLPTSTDSDILLLLVHLSNVRTGFKSRRVEFSRYELIKFLGWPLRFTSSGMNSRYAISNTVDFITTRNTLLTLQGCEEPSRQPKTFLLYLVPLLSRSRG